MKRTTISIFISIFFLSQAIAQYGSRQSSSSSDHPFTVGIAPFSLIFRSGKVNLRGEWAYADNKSLSLLVAVPRPTKVPGTLLKNLVLSDSGQTSRNRFTQWGLTLENRFYLSNNAPAGFYLAPYLRYNRFGIGHTQQNGDTQYETKIVGAISGVGLGGAMGVQFKMGEHMTMDITFVGIDFKWMRGSLSYTNNDPNNDIVAFRNKVQEAVKDVPLVGNSLKALPDGNTIRVKAPLGVWPGYRFNLSVNYAF